MKRLKLVGRIVAIVMVALLVVGATAALAQTSYGQSLISSGPGEHGFAEGQAGGFQAGGVPGTPPAGFERGDREGEESGSLLGIVEVFKNVLIVASIVAGVTGVVRLVNRLRPRAQATA